MRLLRRLFDLGGVALVLTTLQGTASADEEEAGGAGKSEGEKRDSEPLAEWEPADNDRIEPHHARSMIEMGAGLALGSVAYWLMMDRNVADWDNPTPQERFNGVAWRLDNNSLPVNFIAHPAMGAYAHSFARANHHDVWTSFGYGFLTSFLWEFVLEFKEKVSVNDIIATPMAGLPIGEFFYKLGLYLDTASNPGTGSAIARWWLGTGVALDRTLDGREPPRVTSRDALGYTKKIWHEFDANYGVNFARSGEIAEYSRHTTGIRAMLVTLPGYLESRSFGRFFHGAEVSDFSAAFEASRHGVGLTMTSDTLLLGYHAQDFVAKGDESEGAAATFGVSLAYTYHQSTANRHPSFEEAAALPGPDRASHVPTTEEQFSAVHLPGPAVDYRVRAPHVALSLSARAHPDFAGIGAPAFYDFTERYPDDKAKHILHRQGYFYGWGGSGSLRGKLNLGPFYLSGSAFYGRYDSQDGLDRHIETVVRDVPARAEVISYSADAGLEPWQLPIRVGVHYGVRSWYSWVGGFERRGRVQDRGFSAGYVF